MELARMVNLVELSPLLPSVCFIYEVLLSLYACDWLVRLVRYGTEKTHAISALILSSDGAKGGLDLTTTICHRYSEPQHFAEAVKQADVVVSATGVPGLIRYELF